MFTLQAATVHGIAHSLRADGFDVSEDGTGRRTPIIPIAFDAKAGANTGFSIGDIPGALRGEGHGGGHAAIAFSSKDHGADAGDLAPTLRAMGHDGSHANAGGQVAVAFQPRFARNDRGGPQEELAYPLTAEAGRTGKGDSAQCVAFMENVRSELRVSEQTDSLTGGGGKPGQGYAAALINMPTGWAVRRLTPIECERLMGMPDNYTRIPWRGKPAEGCPDGPRYKCLGNSIDTHTLRWIGERIELCESVVQELARKAA